MRRHALLTCAFALAPLACLPDDVPPQPDAGPDASVADAGPDRDAGVDRDAGPAIVERDPWWKDRVFYEIFVRSFQDSDGDGIGDLAGLTSRLDYLESLGVGGIWLMPIHPSPSYHGYDVTDYLAVNPQYGTLADFEALLDEAHQRDIRVIIDLVVNHSSREHPWFVDARSGAAADHRDYYNWRADDPGWRAPVGLGPDIWHRFGNDYYYGVFGGGLPDLNHANEAVYEEIRTIADTWLDRGLDGFRFDAVRYLFENEDGDVADLPETHAYFERLKADLVAEHPDALFVAEAWSSTARIAQYYSDGAQFDLAFEFEISQGLQLATASKDVSRLRSAIASAERLYSDRAFAAPFITNHDMNRLMRDVRVDQRAFRVAVAALMALPGTPFVYYGEEIGMRGGGLEVDEDKRTPFRWTAEAPNFGFTTGTPWRSRAEDDGVDVATQEADPDSLLAHFKRMIALRRAEVTPRLDTFAVVANPPEDVVAWQWGDADPLLFTANFGDAERTVRAAVGSGAVELLAATASVAASRDGSDIVVTLPAQSFGFVSAD